MKVLMLSHADVHGGASMAALRLYRALTASGSDVSFLVGKRFLDEPGIIGPSSPCAQRWADLRSYLSLGLRVLHRTGNEGLHSYNLFPSGLAARINAMDVDLVNIHWPHRELLSIAEIGRVRHPIVWTLHDMWAFCGSEHYENPEPGGRYLAGYGEAQGFRDLDHWTWERKVRHWQDCNFSFVGPSRWMTDCVRQSELLGHHPAHTIPNCLDIETFKPRDKLAARQKLGLPPDRRLILSVALSIDGDRRKGLHQLVPALRRLAESRDDVSLLIAGADAPKTPIDFGVPTVYLGKIDEETEMAAAYTAAEVFVAPSLQDNLVNTVLESLACGTLAVAFDIGGMADLIEDGGNGALATPFDSAELAEKLAWVLDPARGDALCTAARRGVEERHAPAVVADQYLEIFRNACR